eukprot:CAMPEP_0171642480 /NCGR_PEP_ID=MMETSP0990-20121206/31987_1 /TAXON_ID=483369 /ORGANISM="non described non described, Strain CCMP2098" /LENGTH=66 /DNA_ID=CAMNT_0012217723 /DNA_START=317 /DNA_END=517 /DNA_ORIENTATION=-
MEAIHALGATCCASVRISTLPARQHQRLFVSRDIELHKKRKAAYEEGVPGTPDREGNHRNIPAMMV